MNVSLAKLMKLWITVVLCFGALSDALETRTNSSPPEAIADQRSSPVSGHSSSLYGGLLYDEGPSAAAGAKDGPHGPGTNDDDSFYLDQEEDRMAAEGEEADQPKRSMGMLRLGRGRADKRPRSMAGLRLGRRSGFETGNKRSMGMLRLGRTAPGAAGDFDGEGEEGKRSMGMLRLGRSQGGLRRRASSSLGR